jgi:hypothetical protein
MRTLRVLTSAVMLLPTLVAASPDPVLPWTTASFSFSLDSGAVEFRMECPGGVLRRLSATRGGQAAELPMSQLAALSLSKTCAGAATRAMLADEGSQTITGISLRVQLSHEYILEELQITFDLQSFRFTQAMHTKSYAGDPAEVTRMQLQ